MTVFISGGAKNGKSTLAQNIAVSLSGGSKHYYVATMIPSGAEDYDRIRRHIADREGLDFETLECSRNLMDCLENVDKDSTFLVDSVTALVQNALFPIEKEYEMDPGGVDRCTNELIEFAQTVSHVVYVSDYIYSDAQRYSETTEAYRKCLADADRRLAKACDVVIEVSAGQVIFHKGGLSL